MSSAADDPRVSSKGRIAVGPACSTPDRRLRLIHREAFAGATASLERRKDRLAHRQEELARREEKVLVFGEPEAKPVGSMRTRRSCLPTISRASPTWRVGPSSTTRSTTTRTPAICCARYRGRGRSQPSTCSVDQGALDRTEARIDANPNLTGVRRCTVEHPFWHDQADVGRR